MPTEQWRPIPGFPSYDASDLGRIRSRRRKAVRIMQPVIDSNGYLTVNLTRDGQPRAAKRVHTLIASAFLGSRPDGMEVRHFDGVQTNNAASNLRYGTRSENELDKVRHGTHRNAPKTHCPADHAYDELNTYSRRGRRHCRACHRARQQRRALRAAGIETAA